LAPKKGTAMLVKASLEAGQRQPSRAQACRGAKGGAKGQGGQRGKGGHQGIEDLAWNTQGNAGQRECSEDRARQGKSFRSTR